MNIQKVKISAVNPAPYNPRIPLKPGDIEYEKLKKSIDTFGLVEPLVWNKRTGNLIGGHQRLRILTAQGVTEVEVSVVDLSPDMEKALNIALNKITGDWDERKLSELLTEIQKIPDFDIGLTGFDIPEISELLDSIIQSREDDGFDIEEALNATQEPVTKRGDLIQLGLHRLLCGDSSNPDDMKILMNGEKADILDCDFPYNVNYGGGAKPNPNTRPKNSRKWNQIYSDDMPQAEYEAWMKKVLILIKQHLKPGAAIYIWQGLRQFPPMYQILLDLDFHVSCFLCWLKESAAITYADYCYRTEQCLYGWFKGAPHYWAGKPAESNVWEVKRDPTKSYVHPTQKPVQLAQRAIKNSSKIGDIVLDTFLGSGSVLIGAESLNRRCFGMELDPQYCDVVVRRYISYIGKDKAPADLVEKYWKEDQHVCK
ncbi:MAG TPA: site-specific DNA-methyltransferase [Candidatus Wunengus sp. YC60]|uniref:site-specific DNA-methyltransferase n=1 Tax=Candidatus Wunengus sp. YC60 TaxID=3367697 RepID=UPI0040257E70